MLAVDDVLTLLLVVGLIVLVVSTTITAMGFAPPAWDRRRRTRRGHHPLSPSAAHELELARARAAVQAAQAIAAAPKPVRPLTPTGQIIDISDGPRQGREMSADMALAIAERVAETDPHRVAEVINQWIRADSKDPLDLFR